VNPLTAHKKENRLKQQSQLSISGNTAQVDYKNSGEPRHFACNNL
tara:strand:- start:241 stop:375 length:135 start_codon:yes stop_codon:yes gene_type:complete